MNLYEYQIEAMAFAPPGTLGDQVHGLVVTALGLSGEALELGECVLAREGWKQDAIKELGDCCWYVARGCAALGLSMEFICTGNDYLEQVETLLVNFGDAGKFELADMMLKTGARFGEIVKKVYGQGHDADVPALTALLINYWVLLESFAEKIAAPISTILEANIAKLRARFPDGFTVEASVGRIEG
jgi:hypothetical protein